MKTATLQTHLPLLWDGRFKKKYIYINSDGQLLNTVIFLPAIHINTSNFCFKTNRACKYDKPPLYFLKEIYSGSICFPRLSRKPPFVSKCHTRHLCAYTPVHIRTRSKSTRIHWCLRHLRYVGGDWGEGAGRIYFVSIGMHNIYWTRHFALDFAFVWGGGS